MLKFTSFLAEEDKKTLKFHQDNPGGDWEKYKQEDAEADMKNSRFKDHHRGKGMRGPVTGYFNKPAHIPTSKLKHLPGAMGEERFRNDGDKLKALEKEVGHPSKFDTKEHPVFVAVNHKGHAYVMEGNHRIAYAAKHNIPHVHAEIRYYNGGEKAKGILHPDTVMDSHKED